MANLVKAEAKQASPPATVRAPTTRHYSPGRLPSPVHAIRTLSQPGTRNGAAERRHAVFNLQRTIGNRATGRLLRKLADTPVPVQKKLTVGRPDDAYEREADAAASRIESGQTVERISRLPAGGRASLLDREPVRDEEEVQTEPVQRKCESCREEEDVQRQTASPEPALDTDRAAEVMARAGGGSPLEPAMQTKMERGFGADFSGVRVHTGGAAREASDAINGRAFTHGSDIYMGSGGSPTDHRLMAHELTHVVQQGHRSAAPDVRRTMGDEHDLQSPRFAGNLPLEAAFDNESYVQIGARGEHVAVLQQALGDAGHPLLKYAEDGIFGSETHGALKSYQSERGLRVDGIVGQETMGDLDRLYATSPPHPHIPPELPDICSLLLLEQNVRPDENGLVSIASLTPEQKDLAEELPARTLPDGEPAIECQIPGVTPQTDKDWYMLKPPPIYEQGSLTCWAASLASWLNVRSMSTITDNGLLDIYKSPPSTCLDRRGVLLYAHDDAVFGEWWMKMVKVERAEWEKVKSMLRTHGHLVVATDTDSKVAHDMVIYGYGFDEKGEPCSGCVSLMDRNGGTYRNEALYNLGFPLYLGIPKSERGMPAECRKKPLP